MTDFLAGLLEALFESPVELLARGSWKRTLAWTIGWLAAIAIIVWLLVTSFS